MGDAISSFIQQIMSMTQLLPWNNTVYVVQQALSLFISTFFHAILTYPTVTLAVLCLFFAWLLIAWIRRVLWWSIVLAFLVTLVALLIQTRSFPLDFHSIVFA